MGWKENTLLNQSINQSINQSTRSWVGLASVPLGFVFMRLWCYKPTLFFHTIIWAKVFTCCRVLPYLLEIPRMEREDRVLRVLAVSAPQACCSSEKSAVK